MNSTTLCSLFFINYGIHPIVFLIEAIDLNNPYLSDSLKSVSETRKFSHNRIANLNEKMQTMLIDHGYLITSEYKIWYYYQQSIYRLKIVVVYANEILSFAGISK